MPHSVEHKPISSQSVHGLPLAKQLVQRRAHGQSQCNQSEPQDCWDKASPSIPPDKKKEPALLKGTEEWVKTNPVMETVWVLDQATPGLPMDQPENIKKAPHLIPHIPNPLFKGVLSSPRDQTDPGAHPANSPG